MLGTVKEPRRGVDASQILRQRRTADLDLGAPIAEITKAANFIGQKSDIIAGVVISTSSVDRDSRVAHFGAGGTIRQKSVKRQVRDLRRSVPERHIERTDSDTALAMAARLFAGHHYLPCAERVEVFPCFIHDINLAGCKQAGREPLPNEATLCEATDRRKAVADYGLAIPDNISDHRHHACG